MKKDKAMTGLDIPMIGFGTYGRTGRDGIELIRMALEMGYRHLDTAQTYGTETETGAALRESGVARDSVFLTTKIAAEHLAPGRLVSSLAQSCARMGMDRVDLALIHWPAPNDERPLSDYLPQLVEAREAGLTRHIGVSNFPIAYLEQAEEIIGPDQILTNQIECNVMFQNRNLVEFCRSCGILVTCYQPIAHGAVTGAADLKSIAQEVGATEAQVALAWALGKGYAVIPTSSKPSRIAENFLAKNLRLSAEQISRLDAMPQKPRSIDPDWGPEWDPV
ncbi:aldo/keto reductase [Limimaricola sp. AA108-03]|uniref:aldo/keto reductase n=1 Tax=Limimaricola sp. AA108-03 TaxID=3425945 RepID=UPI003D789100